MAWADPQDWVSGPPTPTDTYSSNITYLRGNSMELIEAWSGAVIQQHNMWDAGPIFWDEPGSGFPEVMEQISRVGFDFYVACSACEDLFRFSGVARTRGQDRTIVAANGYLLLVYQARDFLALCCSRPLWTLRMWTALKGSGHQVNPGSLGNTLLEQANRMVAGLQPTYEDVELLDQMIREGCQQNVHGAIGAVRVWRSRMLQAAIG